MLVENYVKTKDFKRTDSKKDRWPGYIEPNLRGRIDRHRFLRCVAKPYDTNALPQLIGDMIDQARRKIDGLND